MLNDLFELTPQQESAFKRFKAAHDECVKSGIYLFNNYGIVGAVDRKKIVAYDDDNSTGAIEDNGQCPNSFRLSFNEWCDDPHWFHPA